MAKHCEVLVNYILEHEFDDFYDENPSKYHVYYSALVLTMGEERANIMLEEALKRVNGEDQT